MKRTTEIYAHNERVNEYGVKIEDTVFCHTKTLTSGAVYEKEYVWEQKVGDTRYCMYSCKQEKRMQKAMQEGGFYNR